VTSRFGVIGSPIGHSRSPALHRAAISALGIDATYEPTDVAIDEIDVFMTSRDPSWEGLSLTMPLKQVIRRHLVSECPVSILTGSVNTIVRSTEGWRGYNTDTWGATTAIRQQFGPEFRRATLLGGGATAASLIVTLHDLGVDSLEIFVRDTSRAETVRELARRLGMDVRVLGFGESAAASDLLVSTLPAGSALTPGDIETFDAEYLFDVVYDPWPSALSREWDARGLTSMNGLPMLLWQAVRQARVFYGESVDEPLPDEAHVVTMMRAAVGL
jgi:shikimate dehydrogenase